MKNSDALRVLGLDIGATHSRARLVAGQAVIAEAKAPSASVAAEGAAAAVATLDGLLAQLPLDNWCPLDSACVGAAGLVSETTIDLFEKRLSRFTKDGLVLIVGDGYLVLPAADLTEGVGVICGTGTVALAQIGDRSVRAGGWGYLIGDDGSGYWIVREAIRNLLDRKDRGRPLGALGADLLHAVNVPAVENLRDLVYMDQRPGKWASFAPVVLDSSDPFSSTIVARAAEAVNRLIDAALEGLGKPPLLPIVLAGGLTGHDRFRVGVVDYLRSARPRNAISVLEEPPVVGAVRLAQLASFGPVPILGGARRVRW